MLNVSLTDKQKTILETLVNQGPMTPTEIGRACGKTYDQASSWASGGLRKLKQTELVDQLGPGQYRATEDGRTIIHDKGEK